MLVPNVIIRTAAVAGSLLAAVCAGCGPRAVVEDPKAITLRAALSEVGEGLAAMVKSQPQSSDFGIYPAEVTVTFNVAASGTSSGALMVTPGFPDLTPATNRAGMQANVGEAASRANQVTVKFVNVLFAPPDALVQHVTGTQLYELRQAMLGIDPRPMFITAPPSQPAAGVPAPATETGQDVASAAQRAAAPAAAPTPVPASPATPASPLATRPADLPAMKFLSPFKPEDDPAAVIAALTTDRARTVARAINDQFGMRIVDPALEESALRAALQAAAAKYRLDRRTIEKLSAFALPSSR